MLDGLRYVLAQIALIVAVTALLASVLGWLLGRASGKRRAEKAAAASPASRLAPAPAHSYSPRHAMEATGDAPVPVAEDVLAHVSTTSIPDVTEPVDAPVFADAAARQYLEPSSPVEESVAEAVTPDTRAEPAGADADEDEDEDEDEDPDRTVLRPPPGMTSTSGTPLYAPPRFALVTSTLTESGLTAGRPESVQEVQELRRELRAKELELGKLEAGALSAWDRTVPHLEAQISDLLDENASLRRQIRDADEHSDADAKTVERLRSQVAERDSRLAEIRAQS